MFRIERAVHRNIRGFSIVVINALVLVCLSNMVNPLAGHLSEVIGDKRT